MPKVCFCVSTRIDKGKPRGVRSCSVQTAFRLPFSPLQALPCLRRFTNLSKAVLLLAYDAIYCYFCITKLSLMRKLILLLSATLVAANALASPISPEQALNRLSTNSLKLASTNTFSANDLVYTETRDNLPTLYLFSKPGAGFLLLSADDVAIPVLGYSDSNTSIDPANIPANMRWWLSEYANEIAATHRNTPYRAQSDNDDKAPIEPLCTTLWDQGDPYNSTCPTSTAPTATPDALPPPWPR